MYVLVIVGILYVAQRIDIKKNMSPQPNCNEPEPEPEPKPEQNNKCINERLICQSLNFDIGLIAWCTSLLFIYTSTNPVIRYTSEVIQGLFVGIYVAWFSFF